jgi:NDP-sugar pyrophosphorylase family protein
MISRVMDGYYKAGIRRFTVVVGDQDGSVVEWLLSKWRSDVKVHFAPQGHQRGTASTLFATRSFIDGPFIISPCDTLASESHATKLSQYFDTHPSDVAVLSLRCAPDEAARSAGVLLDPRGHVMYISERPIGAHQDYMTALPIYGFTPRVLEYLDKVPVLEESGERALAVAIQMMIDDGNPVGAVEADWSMRIDTPQQLMDANFQLLEKSGTSHLLSELPDSVKVTPPVYVDSDVIVGNNVKLGPNVYLEPGSVVGPNAILRNVLVLGVRVGGGQEVTDKIISREQV